MADNSSIPVASGNETFANKDVSGVKYPRVLLTWGTGTPTDASAAQPIPVAQQGNITIGTMPAITGTVTANAGTGTMTIAGAVTNAGTFVTQENGSALTALQLIDDTIIAQGGALGTTKNTLIGGSVTTAAPSYTSGQISPFSMDTAGNQRVTINPAQLGALVVNSVPVITGGNLYKQVLGGSSIICTSTEAALGGVGSSYLEHIVIIVTDPTNCNVQVRDGSGSAWYALPNDPAGGVGVYHTAYGILNQSAGGFTVSAAAGSFAIVTGRWP